MKKTSLSELRVILGKQTLFVERKVTESVQKRGLVKEQPLFQTLIMFYKPRSNVEQSGQIRFSKPF